MSAEAIVIGFTTAPGYFYRRALRDAARERGVELQLNDLSVFEQVRWEKVDALFLPGGPDINPCYYLSCVDQELKEHTKRHQGLAHLRKKSRKRDAFEHALLMEVFHNRGLQNLPVLGIGRGMQMLAVALGVPLYLDLRRETGLVASRFEYVAVEPVPQTRFREIIGDEEIGVIKTQHQGVRLPYYMAHHEKWPELRVSGLSHRRQFAEAIELTNRPVLGLQFHPELSRNPRMKGVFHWLIDEAHRRSLERRRLFTQEQVF